MGLAEPGSRVGDYVIEAEARPNVFVSTHRLLPRRAHIVLPEPERAFELACVLEAIRHPAVPRVYECGRLDDQRPWLAVAVLDGPTLAARITVSPLAVIEVVALIRDLATVLAHAHGNGIVHGDLRADCIVQTTTGWCIVDWSEAGPANDHAIDVEALGAVAYAALARALPTLPIARRCPGVPDVLARLIDGMLGAAPTAAHVHERAASLVEDLAQPAEAEVDPVPIAIEDIVLCHVTRPPPIPQRLRVRAQGTGPVAVGRIALEKKDS